MIATFNRSNALAFALDSLVSQTFDDWEAIVIGDACTDDTEQVVNSRGDARIHFLNLDTNTGDQSGPNSVGLRLARGEYVAFLNQDDLWLANHLQSVYDQLSASKGDLLVSGNYTIREVIVGVDGVITGMAEGLEIPRTFRWTGNSFVASGWLIRRQLAGQLLDWKPAASVRYSSSQDYIYRAWTAGAAIVVSQERSLVVIPSIVVSNSYGARLVREQQVLAPLVAANRRDALEALVTVTALGKPFRINQAIGTSDEREWSRSRRWLHRKSDVIFRIAAPIAQRLGLGPWELGAALVGHGVGGVNRYLRRVRGLSRADSR